MIGAAGWGLSVLGEQAAMIIYELRLPRMLLALLNGIALGLAGAVLQIVFRNPSGAGDYRRRERQRTCGRGSAL